ncbi:MAG: NUDIX hydrolase [Deltaproteobacteria bacterium]|nr:NUDIX hydrolase [Deltaproteobacteria bacterium]
MKRPPRTIDGMNDANPEGDVLEHAELYDGVIVKLHRDLIRHSSGRTAVREVVVHPGGVCAVPVLPDGRIVLVRQFRYAIRRYILELPAGKLDSGLGPAETVAHELEEEIGFRAGRLEPVCAFYTTPGISSEVIHLFVARDLTPVPQRLGEGEHLTVESYTLDECLDLAARGEIADAKTLIGIFWYARTRAGVGPAQALQNAEDLGDSGR